MLLNKLKLPAATAYVLQSTFVLHVQLSPSAKSIQYVSAHCKCIRHVQLDCDSVWKRAIFAGRGTTMQAT
jgi:hypothetical protein